MTAPVAGSCGLPAWTARVPKLAMGEGALGGVSIDLFRLGAIDAELGLDCWLLSVEDRGTRIFIYIMNHSQ